MLGSSTMQVAVIDVLGMTGHHCAKRIQDALAALPGVIRARADVTRNEAHVTFDGEAVSISRLMQTVVQIGFVAQGFTRGPAGAND